MSIVIQAYGPTEWYEILPYVAPETVIFGRLPDGQASLIDFRILNTAKADDIWEVEVRYNGEWRSAFFRFSTKEIFLPNGEFHHLGDTDDGIPSCLGKERSLSWEEGY